MADHTTDLYKLIELLDAPDLPTRYDAVVALGRYPMHDDWLLAYNAIEARIEQYLPQTPMYGAMAIALSMMNARNTPGSILYGGPIPDFLSTWDERKRGIERKPTEEHWTLLQRLWDRLWK